MHSIVTRRSFVRYAWTGAVLAASQVANDAHGAPRSEADSSGDLKFLRRLRGPMASISVPFSTDYSIDHASLRDWVDFMCEHNSPVLFQTYGDGELYNLTEDEIVSVIKTVCQQANGRTLVIGGTRHNWTGHTIDFVKRLEDAGADAANIHLHSQNPSDIERALSEIATHTKLPLLAYESNYSADLTRRIAKIPGVMGMKCHAELYRYYDFIRDTAEDRFPVLSAGQMKHFLFGFQIGSPGYLCPLAPFAPQISQKFFTLLEQGDFKAARELIFEFEEPLLKVSIPIGYPTAYKCALNLLGIYKTNLVRPPLPSVRAQDLDALRTFLAAKNLLPK